MDGQFLITLASEKQRMHPVAVVKRFTSADIWHTDRTIWISCRKKDLAAKETLTFPPVAGPCVGVHGCMFVQARWPNYSDY